MLHFLRKCKNYPAQYLIHVHTFQTSSISSTQDYSSLHILLVQLLGFPNKKSLLSPNFSRFLQAQDAKKVSHSNFTENAVSVVQFFEQSGFEQSQIKKIISNEPRLLCANVDKTLKPKLKLLVELGFSESVLVDSIFRNPKLLTHNLKPGVRALRVVLGRDDHIVRILKHSNWLPLSAVAKYLIPNVNLLRSYGVCSDKIKTSIMQQPRTFLRRTTVLQDMLIWVEHQLGIPRNSSKFLSGVYLACFTEKNLEAKRCIFKSFGWTQSEILELMRKNPNIFGLSVERIKTKLDFLMKELGYDCAYLASRSPLINYSLEKRIVPRHRMLLFLKEKGLLTKDHDFFNVVCLTEPNFFEKFVEPYQDVVPDMHRVYLSSSGLVSHPLKELPTPLIR